MDQATQNKIVSFIWGIADDVLRDLFKRGKYPDVILPMCVLRRMDAVLEPTKKSVLDTKEMLYKIRYQGRHAGSARILQQLSGGSSEPTVVSQSRLTTVVSTGTFSSISLFIERFDRALVTERNREWLLKNSFPRNSQK
jgi:type I restriction-modification system DNA methylase subunit